MKKKIKLFVYSYTRDSRMATKELGKLLKISQQSASYLISSFKKKKIIKNYHTIIDPARLGLINVLVYYNFSDFSFKNTNEIISFLKNQDNVVGIDVLEQNYDLVCTYCVPNLSFFNKIHRGFLQKFQKCLTVAQILPLVVNHIYSKKYLLPRKFVAESVIGGDRDRSILSENEMKVLQLLFENPTITILDISRNLKLNPKTVIRIKKSLENKKIICSYSVLWDNSKLGVSKRQILFNSTDFSLDEDAKLLEFCRGHPYITSLTRLIGRFDLLLEMEGENLSKKDVLRELRSEFGVQDYKAMPITESIKKNYVPKALFD